MAKILYLGSDFVGSTSEHRSKALARLGNDVHIRNPYAELKVFSKGQIMNAIHFRTGYKLFQRSVIQWIHQLILEGVFYDLVWVDSGELFGAECARLLKSLGCKVILYNVDDPTGNRDGRRFASLRRAIPYYDLIVVVRIETERECKDLGAKKVLRVFRSYDEIAHNRLEESDDVLTNYNSEVAFIGTWMRHERRDEFLLEMIRAGIPVSIWGARWEKSPCWSKIKSSYKGGSLYGKNYVAAIQGAKVCLGFLSKGNRDLHTQRSLEVPYVGGLFCAERTSEHLELYDDGIEAVFWSDVNECIQVCKELLAKSEMREKIRIAGMQKVRMLNVGNEDVCRVVLNEVQFSNFPILL